MLGKQTVGLQVKETLMVSPGAALHNRLHSIYDVECYSPCGDLKWKEHVPNIVVNEGLNHALCIITVSAHVAKWYVGLAATGAFAAGHTMAAHTGWLEVTGYTATAASKRPEYTPGAIASQSVDNSAAKAVFNVTAATTVGGAFLTSGPTIGGSSGILYGGAMFTTPRAVGAGDTVNVQITCNAAATV